MVSGATDESICLHNHAPQQFAIGLAFHQQAADELGGSQLGGAGVEGLGEVAGSGVTMGVAMRGSAEGC